MLEGANGYQAMSSTRDVIKLVKAVQGVCCKFDAHMQGVMALVESRKDLYTFYQNDMESLHSKKHSKHKLKLWKHTLDK